ncbi:hypothetical protein A374_18955 [Fictibacillus macauensis ZFHKF-1]|uniref:YwqI/YxiC family protein n=1 Tax=Fictibacillus macauensis ZFHKF-1 TaxID=1196324 RepID=I8U9W5_9BACL|nr:YwqI/YxiC family protein [Fictibacillus macauensis]EIT83745.1 hypothetical protein A374_18955 [Fictibacillus macauensis ZFHKF-1]
MNTQGGPTIQLKLTEADRALLNIQTSAQHIKVKYPTTIGKSGDLKTLDRINKLNGELQQLIDDYKNFIIENQKMAQDALRSMSDLDAGLSKSYNILK